MSSLEVSSRWRIRPDGFCRDVCALRSVPSHHFVHGQDRSVIPEIEPPTRPRPVAWVLDQPSFHGIVGHVIQYRPWVAYIPTKTVGTYAPPAAWSRPAMLVSRERKKYPTANRALGRTRDALDVVNQLLIPVVDDVVGRHYSAAFLVSSGNRSRTNSRTTCAEERASSATSWLGQKEAS